MKKEKKFFRGALLTIAFILLILDTKCATAGVSEGITLCLQTVIPAIFPFLLLSPMLTVCIPDLAILRFPGKLLGVPSGSKSIFFSGLLSGYPVGARLVGDAWRNGQLSREDAHRMLAFCNNAGPAFLFGIGNTLFSNKWIPCGLWAIHILSAFMVGAVLPGKSKNHYQVTTSGNSSFRRNLEKSMVIMAYICGWIIVMRVILSFLSRWVFWLFPTWVQVLICGILELANGCVALHRISDPSMRFLILSGILAFGGISVHMQTASVIGDLGGFGYYLFGKLLHTCFSLFLASLVLVLIQLGSCSRTIITVLPVTVVFIFLAAVYIRRKKGSILKPCSV